MTVTVKLPIVYTPPMGNLTVVIVSPLNKKEDPVVEIPTRNTKNNVILPAIVDILMVITLYLEHVEN